MRFALLGPLSVEDDAGPVKVTGKLRRTLLAALLLDAGTPISADRLAALLWGPDAAAGTSAALHNQVMRLRQALGDEDRVRAAPPGYLIDVEPGRLDLQVFSEECAAGRRKLADKEWAEASRRFAAALGLWRGRPLADVPALADDLRIRELEETHVQALQGRIEAELNLSRHHELLGELRGLAEEHPRHEAFRGQLMLALHRAGQQDEAAAAYDAYAESLLDELGIEPGAELRELREAVVRRDPVLQLPPNPNAPRQLPVDTRTFTGRARELAELVAAAADASGTFVISALNGLGGIGKTALAVHTAHRVADRFPDGQLFIDLRGYAAGSVPVPTEEALAYLLRSLGVPPQAIPADPAERAELYRTKLADSRTLIVLDNAANSEQVRPLLPGAVGSLVLITSRSRLVELAQARSLTVDVLGEAEAVELLVKVAGPERGLADSPAVRELAMLCGYVPLALRIVAARLRHAAGLAVRDVLAELRDEDARLGHLTDGERDLNSVFDSSFAMLPGPELNLMRLLGRVPGPDVDPYAAAHLLGTRLPAAECLLNSLVERNLLTQQKAGRYGMHDLIHAYLRAHPDAADEAATAARDRLLDFYRHTAWSASRHLTSAIRWRAAAIDPPAPAPELPDLTSGLSWLRTERANLVAAATDPDVPAALRVDLTAAIAPLLRQDGPWTQAASLHEAAERDARALDDKSAHADTLRNLAQAMQWLGMMGANERTKAILEQACALYQEIGNRQAEADTLIRLGQAERFMGDPALAQIPQQRALRLFQEVGDRLGEAQALQSLAQSGLGLRNPEEVRLRCHQAAAIYRELGDAQAEGAVLHTLGYQEYDLGELNASAEAFGRSLEIARVYGHRQSEATALNALGRIHAMRGAYEPALAELTRSVELYEDLGFEYGTAFVLNWRGQALVAAGDLAAGRADLERSLEILTAGGHPMARTNALAELGWARHLAGDTEGVRMLEQALANSREIEEDSTEEIDALVLLGRAALDENDPRGALGYLGRALSGARATRRLYAQAYALDGIGRCHEVLGDRETARENLREAVALYRRMRLAELDEAEARLAAVENSAGPGPVPTPTRR